MIRSQIDRLPTWALIGAFLPTLASTDLRAATISVAGVVVDGIDGPRVGGARVGLYTDLELEKGAWAHDTTSQSGVYSIVLENFVGDASRQLYVAYYGAGSDRVATPITLEVDPSRGTTIREKPADLVLLSTAAAKYESPQAMQRLDAIARASELLSRADPEAREERAYLRKAAQEVRAKAVVTDPIERERVTQYVGRVELANRLGAGAAQQHFEFLEDYSLAGNVIRVEGVPYELTAGSWEKVRAGAQLHNAWPQLQIQIVGANDDKEADFLEAALVGWGADPNRIQVIKGGEFPAGQAAGELAFAFKAAEADG